MATELDISISFSTAKGHVNISPKQHLIMATYLILIMILPQQHGMWRITATEHVNIEPQQRSTFKRIQQYWQSKKTGVFSASNLDMISQ